MQAPGLVLIFIVLYLIIDLVYITLARPVYEKAVQQIQGAPMTVPMVYAVMAYSVIMIGWWVLIAVRITKDTPVWLAAVWGAVFGLCLYGTFNFTNAAMFQNYRGRVVLQDLLWGVISATGITVAYTLVLRRS